MARTWIYIRYTMLVLLCLASFRLTACSEMPAEPAPFAAAATPTNIPQPSKSPQQSTKTRPSDTPKPASTQPQAVLNPSDTPVPSDTPGPTDTPFVPIPDVDDVAREVIFMNPACIGGFSSAKITYVSDKKLLCIYGFPQGQMVGLKIYDPTGQLVDSLYLKMESQSMAVSFRWGLDLPTGEWRAVAKRGDLSAQVSIPFGMNGRPMFAGFHLLSPPAISPMDSRRFAPFQPGETIGLKGINLQPGMDLPVGIYPDEQDPQTGKFTPAQGMVIHTALEGIFNGQLKLNDLENGYYYIVAFQDPSQPDNIYTQLAKRMAIGSLPQTYQLMFPISPTAWGDDMQPNEVLYPGHTIGSADGRFAFVCQEDGSLVLYRETDLQLLWTSNPAVEKGAGVCIMQNDGNLVIYDAGGTPVWASGTCCAAGPWLLVQDDGNVVIYRPDHTPIWSTGTAQ